MRCNSSASKESFHSCPTTTSFTIVTCSKPAPIILRPKITCRAYFPSVETIKAIRFPPEAYPPRNSTELTNIVYRPILQGGLNYCGIEKLVPFGPPPGTLPLCRPMPLKPSDNPGMIVYSAP